MAQAPSELRFEAPDGDTWTRDASHWPLPVPRLYGELFPPGMAKGFRDAMARYGLLIEGIDTVSLHGFGYNCIRVVSGADEFGRRVEAAARAFATKLWRSDLERWDTEAKPAAIRLHLELGAIDPEKLDAEDLIAYLERCMSHFTAMVQQHHTFNSCALIPLGDFLAHARAWTGADEADLLALMEGYSTVSRGGSPEHDRLVAAIRDDAAALTLVLEGKGDGSVLAELQRLPGEVGSAAQAYERHVGNHLVGGLDIGSPTASEVPEVLERCLRMALVGDDDGDAAAQRVAAREFALREAVPADHRDLFDELLAEARATYRVRDERGVYSDIWAAGILRRAVLGTGRRLVAEGRLGAPEHLMETSPAELLAAANGSGPSADELAARYARRESLANFDPPPFLGPEPAPPPSSEGLPPPLARAMGAMGVAMAGVFGTPVGDSDEQIVRGLAASPGEYEGRARLLSARLDLLDVEEGDVLVMVSTTESINPIVPLIGAIVTDAGGVVSHAAIVARESGIPAVVGCNDATVRIKDGMRVRVNGSTGEVAVLGFG